MFHDVDLRLQVQTVLRVELLVGLLYSVGEKRKMPTCTTAVLASKMKRRFL